MKKERVKQAKKVFAALLAVVMVMGVVSAANLAVYASDSEYLIYEKNGARFTIDATPREVTSLSYSTNNYAIPVGTTLILRLPVHQNVEYGASIVPRGEFDNELERFNYLWEYEINYQIESLIDGEHYGSHTFDTPGIFRVWVVEVFNGGPGKGGEMGYIDAYNFFVGDTSIPSTETQAPTTANNTIGVTINGTAVNFTGTEPTIVDGRTLVPVRGVFETLGFDVSWNPDLRQATLARENDTIVITLDSATFTTNGVNHTLDVPAQVIGGSTMLPIRAVLESVGYSLDWDANTRTVIISTN